MKKVITDTIPKGLDLILLIGDTHIHPSELPTFDGKIFNISVGKKSVKDSYHLSDPAEVNYLLNRLEKISKDESCAPVPDN